jgi:hypothetical protein
MEHAEHHQSAVKTWFVVGLLLLWIFFKGGLAYLMIGDRGMPDWDYRPVKDVPGESPYAIYETLPHIQHVSEDKGEYKPFEYLPYNQLGGEKKVTK